MKIITALSLNLITVFQTHLCLAQHIDFPDLEGAQIELLSNSSIGINDSIYGYASSVNSLTFSVPVGNKKHDLFVQEKDYLHERVEKHLRSKVFQLQLYGTVNNRFVRFSDAIYNKPGLKLGFKGLQYRPVLSYLLYDASFQHIPSYSNADHGINVWSGNFGAGGVSGKDKILYFGIYGVYSKNYSLLLPMIGFKIKNTSKYESSIIFPLQARLTRKWNQDKLWSDLLFYVNGNLIGFGDGNSLNQNINEMQMVNLRFGKRLRYAINKKTNLFLEAGYEFYNKVRYVISNETRILPNNIPGRAYINFSIRYNLKKNNGVGHLFEFY